MTYGELLCVRKIVLNYNGLLARVTSRFSQNSRVPWSCYDLIGLKLYMTTPAYLELAQHKRLTCQLIVALGELVKVEESHLTTIQQPSRKKDKSAPSAFVREVLDTRRASDVLHRAIVDSLYYDPWLQEILTLGVSDVDN